MAKVVVIKNSDGSLENITQGWQFKTFGLRERNKQSKFAVPNIELEKGSTTDDLQAWKFDLFRVDMADQQIPRHFSNVLEKAQINSAVLNPCYFKVAVNVSAVSVAIPQVLVVEIAI